MKNRVCILIVVYLVILPLAIPFPAMGFTPSSSTINWTFPVGGDGHTYDVRRNIKYGTTVENTDYRVRNLDLISYRNAGHLTCFSVGWHSLFHSGVDLYRLSGSTSNAQVKAVADGVVVYVLPSVYPGNVVIVRHNISASNIIYSVYSHILTSVSVNQNVQTGDEIGRVIYQQYDGRYPEFHPGQPPDDSHLHFEMRTFEDARSIFPQCGNADRVGPGYSYPNDPTTYGWVDPLNYISAQISKQPRALLPFVQSSVSAAGCQENQNLIMNGSFDVGASSDPTPWLPVATSFDWGPLILTVDGNRLAKMGNYEIEGVTDEELTQSFTIPGGTERLEWKYSFLLQTTDDTGIPHDYFSLELLDATTGLSLLSSNTCGYDNTYHWRGQWYVGTCNIISVSQFGGRKVRIAYIGRVNGDFNYSSFSVDNVQVLTHCGAQRSGSSTNYPSAQSMP